MLLHGSAAARLDEGVLLLGHPGAGKSDLMLRLLAHNFLLIADDQVEVLEHDGSVIAHAPAALAGRLEVRGLGLLAGLAHAPATLRLIVDCVDRANEPRLPVPAIWSYGTARLPRIALHAPDASAPFKVILALECVAGRRAMTTGAFAA